MEKVKMLVKKLKFARYMYSLSLDLSKELECDKLGLRAEFKEFWGSECKSIRKQLDELVHKGIKCS